MHDDTYLLETGFNTSLGDSMTMELDFCFTQRLLVSPYFMTFIDKLLHKGIKLIVVLQKSGILLVESIYEQFHLTPPAVTIIRYATLRHVIRGFI